jgi:hypothetical protein
VSVVKDRDFERRVIVRAACRPKKLNSKALKSPIFLKQVFLLKETYYFINKKKNIILPNIIKFIDTQ